VVTSAPPSGGSARPLHLIWLVWYERIDPVVLIPARFPVIVEPPTRILAGAAFERRPVPLWAMRTRSSIRLMAMVGAIAAMPSFVLPADTLSLDTMTAAGRG
jgi:hypothetical protein